MKSRRVNGDVLELFKLTHPSTTGGGGGGGGGGADTVKLDLQLTLAALHLYTCSLSILEN